MSVLRYSAIRWGERSRIALTASWKAASFSDISWAVMTLWWGRNIYARSSTSERIRQRIEGWRTSMATVDVGRVAPVCETFAQEL